MSAILADAAVGLRIASSQNARNPWLDLIVLAAVTISVGGQRFSQSAGTWSADCPGEQLIDIRFRRPTTLSRVRVVSREAEQSRTQEMTIWASLRRGERHREVVRLQFTFSPARTEHVEEYVLQLEDVSALQVRIVPSIEGRRATARVNELQVAA